MWQLWKSSTVNWGLSSWFPSGDFFGWQALRPDEVLVNPIVCMCGKAAEQFRGREAASVAVAVCLCLCVCVVSVVGGMMTAICIPWCFGRLTPRDTRNHPYTSTHTQFQAMSWYFKSLYSPQGPEQHHDVYFLPFTQQDVKSTDPFEAKGQMACCPLTHPPTSLTNLCLD